ncbi:MAG: phosphoribosylanthranilate isomerase [Prevotella sp.]|nr:phosphoribosylanthranilate isomerase [Prevotella sp.]
MMIKVCGMREADNIREVEALGIDMMGFIFWPKSSRYVSQRPDYLPKRVKRVGVFVDEEPEQVRRLAGEYGLDYIQLHGHETPEVISYLRTPALPHPRIIKAFNISTAEDLLQTQPYEGLVDYFLFDAKGKSVGGNGEKFNWDVLEAYQGNTPFLLSGGIGPDDAERVNAFYHPKCIGIDLNSRFELAPGLKDITKLREFISNLNTEIQRHRD